MLPSFDNYVIKSILANNEYGIKEVNGLERLHSGYFVNEDYAKVKKIIQEGNIQTIHQFFKDQVKSSEFLEILKFKDQNNITYAIMVYDSNELTQDPQVIEVFPI